MIRFLCLLSCLTLIRAKSTTSLSPINHISDFSSLQKDVEDGQIYMDSAATTLKPDSVIDAMSAFIRNDYANIHRSTFPRANRSTDAYEKARSKVATFVNTTPDNVVFTSGTTESINMIANWVEPQIRPGDVIVLSQLEHHSNLLPWRRIAANKSARIYFAPVRGVDECINEDALLTFILTSLNPIRIVSLSLVSNVLGCELQHVEEIIKASHEVGALVSLDAAQAMTYTPIDLGLLRRADTLNSDADFRIQSFKNLDFLSFSSHKMYGPTGIGAVISPHVASLPPIKLGGGMVVAVGDGEQGGVVLEEGVHRHEAGTPAIVEAVGLGAAIDFIEHRVGGVLKMRRHSQMLKKFAVDKFALLFSNEQGRVLGEGGAGVVSVQLNGIHANDVAEYLSKVEGISARAGYHCAEPLHRYLSQHDEKEKRKGWGLGGSTRISFSIHTTFEDVDRAISGLKKAYIALSKSF